jgi:signal transduction histidine kinase
MSTPQPTLLIVDDSLVQRIALGTVLRQAGFVVQEACAGREALARAVEGNLDLMILDVVLPDLPGYEVCRRLKADPTTALVPVILLSALGSESGERVRGLDCGADGYLVKPAEAAEVVAHVRALLRARQAEEALREADRRKDEFLATLAHELRNPLAPIRNAVQIMKLVGLKDPRAQHARELIERQVGLLARLVDDLMDVARITAGKITLRREIADLEVILHRAIELSRPLIEERRHELTVRAADLPIRLEVDPVRLAQVVSNLLNNAAKYTEAGGHITLTVETVGSEVAVRVRDTGLGIPPELLSRVFDLFTQVDQTLDRSQGGLGIGLTLVKRLVELHGGRVTAASEGLGRGSEFTVYLPLREG